ncbi:targeting protein for Xklp2 homolog [Drosophila ananassae]|nr:targeting protein for Xklp2 homolog [Drosophila ananassae]
MIVAGDSDIQHYNHPFKRSPSQHITFIYDITMSNFETEYKRADVGFPEWSNINRKSDLEGVLGFFDKNKGSSDVLKQQRQPVESTNIESRNALQRFKVSEKIRLGPKHDVCNTRSRNPSMSTKVPPQAYNFMGIYSERKDKLIQQQKEQERKQREFRSRPMPDFRLVHERQAIKVVVHRVTHPVTPNVLRNSQEMEAKRRKRVEQLRKERQLEDELHRRQAPKAKAIPLSSRLHLKPENHRSHSYVVKVEPFNLSSELRVQARRLYNQKSSRMQETRRRELETERQRLEREAYLKQRQLTSFRARPNPFAVLSR